MINFIHNINWHKPNPLNRLCASWWPHTEALPSLFFQTRLISRLLPFISSPSCFSDALLTYVRLRLSARGRLRDKFGTWIQLLPLHQWFRAISLDPLWLGWLFWACPWGSMKSWCSGPTPRCSNMILPGRVRTWRFPLLCSCWWTWSFGFFQSTWSDQRVLAKFLFMGINLRELINTRLTASLENIQFLEFS